MQKIVPTVLVKNEKQFQQRMSDLLKLGLPQIQLDLMDGRFVKERTSINPNSAAKIKTVSYELHLMVKHPLAYLKKWSGVPQVNKIIVHVEAVDCAGLFWLWEICRLSKIKFALAINPATKIDKIKKNLLALKDQKWPPSFLVMTVKPGRGGQKFDGKQLLKIKQLRKLFKNAIIEADGGINTENAGQIIKAGADILAIGNSLNNPENLKFLKAASKK